MQQSATASGPGERTVLRHLEGIQPAIICSIVLVVLIQLLMSVLRGHPVRDVAYIVFPWGVVSLGLTAVFVWSIAGSTVLEKKSGRLTLSLAVGGMVIWEVKSIALVDLVNVLIRERTYGFRSKRIQRYEVVFGGGGEKKELLGFLTKENARLLANGVLREFVGNDSSL